MPGHKHCRQLYPLRSPVHDVKDVSSVLVINKHLSHHEQENEVGKAAYNVCGLACILGLIVPNSQASLTTIKSPMGMECGTRLNLCIPTLSA